MGYLIPSILAEICIITSLFIVFLYKYLFLYRLKKLKTSLFVFINVNSSVIVG